MADDDKEKYLILKNQEEDDNEFNLLEKLQPVFKNRFEIAAIMAVCLILGVIYNVVTIPLYIARSSLIIRLYSSSNILREKDSEMPDVVRPQDFNTKKRMLTSQPVLALLGTKLIAKGYFRDRLEKAGYDQLGAEEQAALVSALGGSLAGGISISNPSDTNILYLSYVNPNPELCRDVPNLLAEAAVEYDHQEQFLVRQNAIAYLNQQLDESRKQVEAAEAKLFKYRQEKNIFETDMDKAFMDDRRSEIAIKMLETKKQRQELQSQIEQLKKLLERQDFTKYTPIGSDGILLTLRKDLSNAEIQVGEMESKYLDAHPALIEARNRVAVLKTQFEVELQITLSKLEFELNVTESQELLLRTAQAELEEVAVDSTEKDANYIILERDANSAKELYKVLLSAVKEVSVNANNMSNNIIYQHETATKPTAPFKPKKAQTLIMALAFGLLLGAGFAFGREYIDQSIKNPHDVKSTTKLPVLASIPLHLSDAGKGKGPAKGKPAFSLFSDNPKSLFTEGIISLRTQLNMAIPEAEPATILITSSEPKEGKTLISSNLAFMLAQDRKKTIIIDCDLHRPSLHKVLGHASRSPGLFDLLVEGMNPQGTSFDAADLSLGDALHLARLKQWTGSIRIDWDSLPRPLIIAYKTGDLVGSNFHEWKSEFEHRTAFPPPKDLRFAFEIGDDAELSGPKAAGREAIDFIKHFPRLYRSNYIARRVKDYVRATGHENLDFIAAGGKSKNPSLLLGSDQMQIVLESLRGVYDRIVLDCPPAWPLSDVSVMTPFIDHAIWVCRAGEVSKRMFQNSVNNIMQVNPKILGVVINAIDFRRDRYYYYGYRYYNYKYYKSGYYRAYYAFDRKQDQDPKPGPPE